MRRYRSLLLIVLLGVVPVTALIAGVWIYLAEDAPPALAPVVVEAPPAPVVPPVEVLAASRDLLVGTLLTANDVTYVPLEPTAVSSSHLRREAAEPSTVMGSVARTALLAGMPLTWAALVRPGQEGFLAAALLPDHRAVTIVVNQATSHAGLIAPGDRVDVIFTMQVSSDGSSQLNSFSRTVLENIRVVAVNRRVENVAPEAEPVESENGQRGTGNTVTLEVLPSEADQLVLATTRGSVSLALRPLSQAGQARWRPPAGLRTLLPPPATKPPEPEPVRVQVFRGDSREEVLLAK